MKEDFLKYQAQTTPHPLAMEVSHAEGSFIYDKEGKAYLDFVAGVSACALGHRHPAVVKAIKDQLDRYMHVMVYGEYVQEAAVTLSRLLARELPSPLESTYLVNSGTEAIDGAIKLARRVTGRSHILYADKAYHGNSYGALSIMGYEPRKVPFQPLLPDCHPISFNSLEDIEKIDRQTAAVFLETIQGGAGFIEPEPGYLAAVKQRCVDMGALLVLDEIQPGFGRTGTLFAFEQYGVVPDILVMGKGMGGGMPIGAFTASSAHMTLLSDNPKLGHITTFGGHPVIAAAALATLQQLLGGSLMDQVQRKEKLIRKSIEHPLIKEIRGRGLMLAAIVDSGETATEIILKCQEKGLILFWLLFEPRAIRLTPPLTITEGEIVQACTLLKEVLDEILKKHKHSKI